MDYFKYMRLSICVDFLDLILDGVLDGLEPVLEQSL